MADRNETFSERAEREAGAFFALLRRKPWLATVVALCVLIPLWHEFGPSIHSGRTEPEAATSSGTSGPDTSPPPAAASAAPALTGDGAALGAVGAVAATPAAAVSPGAPSPAAPPPAVVAPPPSALEMTGIRGVAWGMSPDALKGIAPASLQRTSAREYRLEKSALLLDEAGAIVFGFNDSGLSSVQFLVAQSIVERADIVNGDTRFAELRSGDQARYQKLCGEMFQFDVRGKLSQKFSHAGQDGTTQSETPGFQYSSYECTRYGCSSSENVTLYKADFRDASGTGVRLFSRLTKRKGTYYTTSSGNFGAEQAWSECLIALRMTPAEAGGL